MMELNVEYKAGEYLSNVKIIQIFMLDKIAISQRKITTLLKYSHKIVQNILVNFSL